MTEVEPEFDADERESWAALREWRDSICPDCGNPRAICSNPDGVFGDGFYPQRRICWIRASEQVAWRTFDRKHKNTKPDDAGYLPTDGVAIWSALEDLAPDDDFLDEPRLPAGLSVPAQAPTNFDESDQGDHHSA